jgi:hypothetical protein
MRPNLKEQLGKLIDQALAHSPYPNDPHLHELWCRGLLSELLSYSAQNQREVWQRLEQIQNTRSANR